MSDTKPSPMPTNTLRTKVVIPSTIWRGLCVGNKDNNFFRFVVVVVVVRSSSCNKKRENCWEWQEDHVESFFRKNIDIVIVRGTGNPWYFYVQFQRGSMDVDYFVVVVVDSVGGSFYFETRQDY